MCFAWDKALQMYSHATSQFNILLLSLSAFLGGGVSKKRCRWERTVSAHPAQLAAHHTEAWHTAGNTGRQKQGGKREK